MRKQDYRLSRAEQETIITFNEEDSTANIYVSNGRLRRRLEELSEDWEEVEMTFKDAYGARFIFPKTWVKINPPRRISEETRKKLAENARKNFHGEE